jgi:hypothetical protein
MTENHYREIETIKDPDGVIAVITQRMDTGHLSFRIQKEYEAGGQVRATSYLGRRHIEAIERLVVRVGDRIDILTDIAKVSRANQGYSVP